MRLGFKSLLALSKIWMGLNVFRVLIEFLKLMQIARNQALFQWMVESGCGREFGRFGHQIESVTLFGEMQGTPYKAEPKD